LREWRQSLADGCFTSAIGMVYVFALVWIVSHPLVIGWETIAMVGAGLLLVLLGTWFRVSWWINRVEQSETNVSRAAIIVITLGLALMSRSWLVTAAVACVGTAFWVRSQDALASAQEIPRVQRLMREGVGVVGILLALFVLWQGPGAFPIHLQ